MPCSPTNIDTATPTGLSEDSSESIALRPATLADAAELALIGAAAFLESFTWMLPGADIIDFCTKHHTVAAYARFLALPSTRITLAEVTTGAPVGYAMLATPDLPTFAVLPTDIELKRIYLLSRFRSLRTPVLDQAHQPIPHLRAGQALMDAALANAHSMGRTRLLLGTHAGNQRAIRFYRRNGFADAGTRTFQVGTQHCCDLILARHL